MGEDVMLSPRQSATIAVCAFMVLTAATAQARVHGDVASFYSYDRATASGERFDKNALKAAHLTLPFGSIVNVVNRRNGKSVVVEINDRGPAKWTGRTIDLTRAAAKRIGMIEQGIVPVRLEVACVTRPQLNRAFLKLARLMEARAAVEPQAAQAVTAQTVTAQSVTAQSVTAQSVTAEESSEPAAFQVASAVATEITRPVAGIGNIFRTYVESLITLAGPHVRLTCPDGKPFPEPLLAVLRRAAVHFDSSVEVVSGFRPLAYNRAIYGNQCRRGRCRGDNSQHIRCMAADIRIPGVSTVDLHAWALRQSELGGVGRYRSDFIHVDIRARVHGDIVTWDWRARQRYARVARKHHHHRRYARA